MVILYFGMIAEIAGKEQEVVNEQFSDVDALIRHLTIKYKRLENVLFKVAINQSIVTFSHPINVNDEIAILPPFAGG